MEDLLCTRVNMTMLRLAVDRKHFVNTRNGRLLKPFPVEFGLKSGPCPE